MKMFLTDAFVPSMLPNTDSTLAVTKVDKEEALTLLMAAADLEGEGEIILTSVKSPIMAELLEKELGVPVKHTADNQVIMEAACIWATYAPGQAGGSLSYWLVGSFD